MANEVREKHLLAGLDERARGFTRMVSVEQQAETFRASLQYETLLAVSTLIRAAILEAMSMKALACGESGFATTRGRPISPPTLMAGSIGTRPRNGMPSLSAARSPPPYEKISVRSPHLPQM